MRLTKDESRALGFVGLLLLLSTAARLGGRGEAVVPDEGIDVAALAAAGEADRRRQERGRAPLADGERVRINSAPAEEIMRLPRIGRTVAERIIAERAAGGPFGSAGELTRVPGVGRATAERLAPLLDFEGQPPASPTAAGRSSQSSQIPQRVADPAAGGGGGAPGGTAEVIDVNRATAAELQRLPGVGPVLAARIIAYRDSAGPFRALSDLRQVPGIGPASLEKLRPHVRLGR
jgi:competence protein ComEA